METESTEQKIERFKARCAPRMELQLSPDTRLPVRFGRKINMAGGSYSTARGFVDTRFVHLPWTREARALADVLLREFPRKGSRPTAIVLRSFPRIGDRACSGKSVAGAMLELRAHARRLHRSGQLPRPLTAAQRQELALSRAQARLESAELELMAAREALEALTGGAS